MKKLLIGILALTVVANAGLWSTASGLAMKEKKADAEYTIDTSGFNPRVYEFTTADGKHKCIVVFSSSNENSSPTMQCYKK